MTSNKGRNKRRRPGEHTGPVSADAVGSAAPGPGQQPGNQALVEKAITSGEACARLRRLRKGETDDLIRRRQAHTDDLIRVFRNLAALALFSMAVLALVTYAGIRMGVPPEICVPGGLSGATLLVRAFIKVFETVRPALPDAPEDPPSTGGP